MAKSIKNTSAEINKLNREILSLRQQLAEAANSNHVIQTGRIDALLATDKKEVKVYTEESADNPYRILIENMHEGAITLGEDGIILYCNNYFATMVNLPLQKVIGSKFNNFIKDYSIERLKNVLHHDKKNSVKEEVYLSGTSGTVVSVLMSVTALSLNDNFVLSVILTDLTIQNRNRDELKHRAKELESGARNCK